MTARAFSSHSFFTTLTSRRARLAAALVAMLQILVLSPAVDAVQPEDRPAERTAQSAPGGPPTGSFGEARRPEKELWTRTSRTYESEPGLYETEFFGSSVNYRAGGSWHAIDNNLVREAENPGWYRNVANRYSVQLPPSLAAPVRVQEGREWLSMRLRDAVGRRTVDGATARYADALPGVTAEYTARGDSVKEAVILHTPESPSLLTYDVRTSGLSVTETPEGGVSFTMPDGAEVFAFAPAFAFDASDNDDGYTTEVTTSVVEARGGFEVTVQVDPEWLASPQRQWPVTVDPPILFTNEDSWGAGGLAGQATDCRIAGGILPQVSSYCLDSRPLAVGRDAVQKRRSLLHFDVESVMRESFTKHQVLHAEFRMYLESATGTAVTPVNLRAVTEPWTNDATWERRNTSDNWSTPGGTFDASSGVEHPGIGATPAWYYWYPTSLVQAWVDGSRNNNGFILKQPNEDIDNILRFGSSEMGGGHQPSLHVHHSAYGFGIRDFFTYEKFQLNDRLEAMINVASGYMQVKSKQLELKGTGLDLAVEQYISMGGSVSFSTGRDIGLILFDDGSATYRGPGRGDAVFMKKPDGSFKPSPDVNADLSKNGDGTYTLKFRGTDEKLNFSAGGYLTSQVDRNGNRLLFNYDDSNWWRDPSYRNNRLVSIVDTQGRTVTFTHDEYASVASMTDWTGRTYSYAHNGPYCIDSITDPVNASPTRFVLGNDGLCEGALTRIVDPGGRVTDITYDGQQRVKTFRRVNDTASGAGDEWTFTYGSNSTTVTNPRGKDTTYYYDDRLRVTRVVDARGNETARTYTSNSNVATVTDAALATTTLAWTPKNNGENVTSIKLPSAGGSGTEEVTTLKYDDPDAPHQPSKKSSQGAAYNYDYDSKGNLVGVTFDKDGVKQSPWFDYAYNPNGTLKTITDGNRNQTGFSYDPKGNLTGVFAPGPLGAETFSYDAANRVRTHTDGAGRITTYDYDAVDRIKKITYQDGSVISYVYDGSGNVLTMTEAAGTTQYTYDAQNRLKTKTPPGGGTTTYSYDAAGNVQTTTEAGLTVTYGYNAVDEVDSIATPGGTTTIAHHPKLNRPDIVTFPNGVTLDRDFDKAGRLTSVIGRGPGGGVLTKYAYDYKKAGSSTETNLRHAVTDASGQTTDYVYDELERLKKATTKNQSGSVVNTYEYTYDPNGNRLTQSVNGAVTNYGYNASDQLKTVNGSTTYSYDGNGNMTGNNAGLALAYNAKNQTTSVTPSGGTALAMAYSGPTQDARVTAGSTSYRYSSGRVSAESTSGGTTSYIRDDHGTLIAQRASGGSYYYYLLDGLGSVVGVTNSSGALVGGGVYKYDPYGKELNNPLATAGVHNPWGFASGYYDRTTGLVKFGTRFYDPGLGRWTQRDPQAGKLGQPGTLNRYQYAGCNPVNRTDPYGRDFFDILGTIVGAVDTCLAYASAGGPALQYLLAMANVAITTTAAAAAACVAGVITTEAIEATLAEYG